jgi:hypothetical protein
MSWRDFIHAHVTDRRVAAARTLVRIRSAAVPSAERKRGRSVPDGGFNQKIVPRRTMTTEQRSLSPQHDPDGPHH